MNSKFLTRVELHAATSDNYDTLHSKLAVAGFSRTIKSDQGVSYSLPTAEYYCESALSVAQVMEIAKGCANATGRNSMVISVRRSQAAWN